MNGDGWLWVAAVCLVFCLGGWAGSCTARDEICTAECGEQWTTTKERGCVCLAEVSDG
jgi:hypothetical protein